MSDDWRQNPVKTTIETEPITDLTLPKVTVCPPQNTYTDLNYDLMMIENLTLDYANRTDLLNYAMTLMWDDLHVQVMANLSRLQAVAASMGCPGYPWISLRFQCFTNR